LNQEINSGEKFPVFRDPDAYMKMRHRPTLSGRAKVFFEKRALDHCLAGLSDIRTVCDVPSGPGRLFWYWQERGLRILGYDYSEQMVEASAAALVALNADGKAGHANAFELTKALDEVPDLVASVRFIYYFDEEKRVELLRALAAASRRYVLVQYKTTETLKGHINRHRDMEAGKKPRPEHLAKVGCSHYQMTREFARAGLLPLRVEPIGEFSDRMFVLAEKLDAPRAEVPPAITSARPGLRPTMLVLFLLALVYLMGIGGRSFWAENEAYYALGAQSVLDGNVLLPMIHGEVFADKPPLVFWWVAAVSAVIGKVSEFSARLSNVLLAFAAFGAVLGFARREANRWVGLMAVLILATTYEFWENSGEVNTDIAFTCFLTASWWGLFRLLKGGYSRPAWWVTWGGLALATLAKGPAAPALTALIGICFALIRYGFPDGLRRLWASRPLSGAVLAIAPFALWLSAVTGVHGTGPAEVMLLKHNVGRFLDAFDHQKPWHFYLHALPAAFLPWTPLLLLACVDVFRRWRRKSLPDWEAFASTVALVLLMFFSLSTSKRSYYLLPAFPWLALLCAGTLWRVLLKSVGGAAADGSATQERHFWAGILGMKWGRVFAASLVAAMAAIAIYSTVGDRILESRKSISPLVERIRAATGQGDALVIFAKEDPRLFYYLRERFRFVGKGRRDRDELFRLLRSEAPTDVVVPADELFRFLQEGDLTLYLEGSARHRDRLFYVLTNKQRPGLAPLLGVPIREASGMCFHRGRGTLFLVGDRGQIAEVSTDGKLLRRAEIGGDLEGITVGPDGNLLLARESQDQIVEVNTATLAITRTYALKADRIADAPGMGGDGIEGLCYLASENALFAVNENDPSALLRIELESDGASGGNAIIRSSTPLAAKELAEMALSPSGKDMLVFSDKEDQLYVVQPDGTMRASRHVPGYQQEAIAFAPDGRLFVCEEDGLLMIDPKNERTVAAN